MGGEGENGRGWYSFKKRYLGSVVFKTLHAQQYKDKYNVVCKTKERRKRLTKNQYNSE